MPIRKEITGKRGQWLAEVDGKRLPVIHNSWRKGINEYCDPMQGVNPQGSKYKEYIQALKDSTELVLQKDVGQGDLSRDGYIGVFEFTDFEIGEDHSIRLKLTRRTANPR